MNHETLNLNADAPVEQTFLDTTTARTAEGAAPEPVSHDPGAVLSLTEAQAVARLQQTLEFPAEDDVTLLLRGADGATDAAATGAGATAGATPPGATATDTAAAGTTPASTTPGATDTATGTTATDTATGTTTTGTAATGTSTTGTATTGTTTTGTAADTTATGTPGAAATSTEDVTMADLNTLGIDHVIADLSGINVADLEDNQGSLLIELGLDTTATGAAAAAELLTLIESFDEPVFADAANVGLQVTQAESDAFDAAPASVQEEITTRLADLGVDFLNVVGTADPDDAAAV